MTEEHDHNQDAEEREAGKNAGNQQDEAQQSEAPQTEDQEAANPQDGNPQAENQQESKAEGSTTPEEPPAGTTTPGTLFASDEMEGMKSEEAKKKEEEQQKRKEAANQGASSEKKYPSGTELRHSGHTKVLPEEMSEAQIHKWIADDFPEIEAGKWSLRYDSTKSRLVPIPPAQKKGATAEAMACADPDSYEVLTAPPETDRPPVYRLLCADGVYEVRSNPSGTYVARLDSELTLAEGYYPPVPKAP
ncbi:MAG: hypothetical protein L0G70_08195, partial [Rubrobacter sp.]|nr:hypothetical protein [Rubrobacter sp.]